MKAAVPPKAKGLVSKERMIDATILLMRQSGLTGAGINEIVRASGSPKGSVYHFFPGGKEQIASEALSEYSRRLLVVLDQALGEGETPGDKVRALFKVFAQRMEEGQYRQSCAAGAVCVDLDSDLEAVREVIAKAFAGWVERIAAALRFEDRRRAKSFAGLLLTAIEGAGIRGRAERSSRAFREAGAWLGELADRERASS